MNHAWRQAYQDLHGIWGLVERIDFAAKEAEARTLAHGIALNILNIAASIDRSRWQNAYVEFIGFQLNDPSRVWERLMDRHGGDEFIRTKNCVHNLLALAFAHSHLGEQAIKVAARQVERLEKKEDGVIGVTDFDREDIVIALYIRGVARLIVQPGGDRAAANDFDKAWGWATYENNSQYREKSFWVPPPVTGDTSNASEASAATSHCFTPYHLRAWIMVLLHRELTYLHLRTNDMINCTTHLGLVQQFLKDPSSPLLKEAFTLVNSEMNIVLDIIQQKAKYSSSQLKSISKDQWNKIQNRIEAGFGGVDHLLTHKIKALFLASGNNLAIREWLLDSNYIGQFENMEVQIVISRQLVGQRQEWLLNPNENAALLIAITRLLEILKRLKLAKSEARWHPDVIELIREVLKWIERIASTDSGRSQDLIELRSLCEKWPCDQKSQPHQTL